MHIAAVNLTVETGAPTAAPTLSPECLLEEVCFDHTKTTHVRARISRTDELTVGLQSDHGTFTMDSGALKFREWVKPLGAYHDNPLLVRKVG